MGVKLGQTRTEALTAMVGAGVVPDLDKVRCSDAIPERNKAVANRICKLTIQPGGLYLGVPVNKVSLMFQDENIVLIGLDVGSDANTFATLRKAYEQKLGAVAQETKQTSMVWNQEKGLPVPDPDTGVLAPGARGERLKVWADTTNALVVYSYSEVNFG